MGIKLFFNNRIETLLDKFSEVLDFENSRRSNPLIPSFAVVPNLNMKKWLKLRLAQKRSIMMNMDFGYLEEGFWKLLSAASPSGQMITQELRRMLVFHVLSHLDRDDTAFEPVFRYLFEAGPEKGPDFPIKLWQLADRLAFLFREYEYHRSAMIQAWQKDASSVPDSAMETCQQKLYRFMLDCLDKIRTQNNQNYYTLAELAEQSLSTLPGNADGFPFVHIFGFSQISKFHLDLIYRLGKIYSIYIYTLNPCEEFWEDIYTPAELQWSAAGNNAFFEPEISQTVEKPASENFGNELLSLWGRPGREHIQLVSQLAEYDLDFISGVDHPPKTVLHHLQQNILKLRQSSPQRCPQDTSLQIVACPSRLREVETVYNSILYNLQRDDDLQLTDIAVLVPDVTNYKPLLDLVFNRSQKTIGYSVVDVKAESESLFGQGISSLLQIADGRFSRKSVFPFLLNPCVMHRWGYGADDVSVWIRWVENLNIFHGFDKKDKAERGYPKSDLYTWKKGLLRLRFSRLMSQCPVADAGYQTILLRDFEGIIPYSDMDTEDLDRLETFNIIIERLHKKLSSLKHFQATGSQWKAKLMDLLETFIQIPPGLRGEQTVKEALFSSFDQLGFLDLIDSDTRLSLPLIREFIKARLEVISGGYGDYLTGGVTISALMPMRPIPFKIIYLMGMEEGGFPGKPESDILDLRLAKRHKGDSTTPEKNCYLFLEMLLSARNKVYISYMARDLQRDQVLQPSSPVSQLRRYIERHILPENDSFVFTEVPLKGSSASYLAPSSENLKSDVMVNYSLVDRIMYYRENALWETIKNRLSKQDIQRLESVVPNFFSDTANDLDQENSVVEITIVHLKKFLEDPVLHVMNRFLGIYEPEQSIEEKADREDEYFYSEFPYSYQLTMNPLSMWTDLAVTQGLKNSPDLKSLVNQYYDISQKNSCTSEGAFGSIDRESILDEVLQRGQTLTPFIDEMFVRGNNAFCTVKIGEASSPALDANRPSAIKRFAPILFPIETLDHTGKKLNREVYLHAQRSRLWQDDSQQWHTLALAGTSKRPEKIPDRYVLEPLLFFILLTAGYPESNPSETVHIHIGYKDTVCTWSYLINPETSKAYLKDLLADYLMQTPLFWLPFSQVRQALKQSGILKAPVSESDVEKKAKFRDKLMDFFENADEELVALLKPEIPENAYDASWRRVNPFFNHSKSKD